MPLDQNKSFKSSATESTATSMISSTGLTINNQIIGGLHAYPLLVNIKNGEINNKIPLISNPGGSSTSMVATAGCDDDNGSTLSTCYKSQAAVTASGGKVGDVLPNVCGVYPADQLNLYCEYNKEVTVTTPASLSLNPDLHSSGRLQLGMIVYIQEKKQAYQFMIDGYKNLYDAAETAGSITTSEFSSAVSGAKPAGEALINAWTDHKIEGELKNSLDASQGTWSRDEANWKKYPNEEEYFAINNVPASESIDNFNFEDAIIVVPPSWNNKKVLSVTSSIFTVSSSAESTITLNQTAPDGTTSTKDWTHGANSKNATGDFSQSPLTLVEGATLHLSQTPKFGVGNLGYTATFKVKG